MSKGDLPVEPHFVEGLTALSLYPVTTWDYEAHPISITGPYFMNIRQLIIRICLKPFALKQMMSKTGKWLPNLLAPWRHETAT